MAKPYSDPARKAWPFFALFVLVGLGLLTPFVLQGLRDYRISFLYQPTECEVIGERQVTSESNSRLGGRWVTTHYSHREFTWAYKVGKRNYVAEGFDNQDGVMSEPDEMGNISKGVKRECWYDPANPEKSVLVRHFHPKFYLGALIPGFFILIGGSLMRGTLRKKPAPVTAKVSRGDHLPYRLSPVLSTRGVMGCLGLIVVVLGLFIVLGLPRISISGSGSSLLGEKTWAYLICIAIEGFLIYHLARAAQAARVPDPVVELEINPLRPGQTTKLYLRHPGPAKLESLQVQIVCEKIGEHGTRNAHKHMLINRKAVAIEEELELKETFSLPPDAEPSAKTIQTATTWCVRVRRKPSKGTAYDTDYPFQVEGREVEEQG